MNDLTTITSQLTEAQADLALFQRLTSAEARVKQLTKEHDIAKAVHDAEMAANEEAAREAIYAGITDIRVDDISSSTTGDGLLHRNFAITYTRDSYDWASGKCLTKEHVVHGFGAAPQNVLLYLIDKRPERIPAAIMALAPGNPRAAIAEYALARRRGFVIGKAVA